MIKVEIEFDEKEALQLFKANGIEIKEIDIPGIFGPVGKTFKVVNPTNGYTFPLERAFKAVIDQRMKNILLHDTDKLTIYNTLNNLK